MIGIRNSSAEYVDFVPVGLGLNIVSRYDESELQELRQLDDYGAHSPQKVAPANDPVELGPPTRSVRPYMIVVPHLDPRSRTTYQSES
jgi:hypothetical protein